MDIKSKYIVTAIVALFIAAGTLAFKQAGKSEKALTTEWYTVTGPANDPSQQQIGGITSAPEPGDHPTDCALLNAGPLCKVQLQFDDSQVEPEDLEGLTVQEANDDHEATAEAYARDPEP